MIPHFVDATAYTLALTCILYVDVLEANADGFGFAGSRRWTASVALTRRNFGEGMDLVVMSQVPAVIADRIKSSLVNEEWIWLTAIPMCNVSKVRASGVDMVRA